uniref:Reverse transcriptase domain-containing protein n=1 Tax=Tanacetum cinerariifolium TaxID=118510 RepID=A0A6L2K7B8_TANCI|nr:reverse transcriptase domain-containing protein [Tanacetum cinerariifolium]
MTTSNIELKNMFGQFMKTNIAFSLSSGSLLSNIVPNPSGDLNDITTRSGVTLAGPSVSPHPSKEVDQEPETITDQVLIERTNNVPPLVVHPSPASTFSTISFPKMPEVTKDTVQPSTENIQPLVAQTQVPIDEPVVAPKTKLTIPYPSRANKQKLHEKDDNLALKFVEIFRNLQFELSFAYALLNMPKFSLMFKSLLNNKKKLFDLAMTLVNENCSAFILKKLPKKFGDPDKFLIPCDFLELDECLAPEDLGASINLMSLSIWRKHSFPSLISTTRRALIYVYGEELTLRVDDEAITFKVGQTSKYSYNDAESINQIDVIDTFLRTPDELSNLDDDYYDTEGDILYLKKLLNDNPSPNILPMKTKDLKQVDVTMTKPSIDEPPELELKELPSHLKYVFLEGTDKLPVIISKELKDEETYALLKARSKGAKNLAADHLSRFKNPHQNELEKKEITETFLLKTLGENHASWSDKLADALWAFRTAFKTPIGCTPYKFVYEKACHLPIELENKASWALKHCNFDLKTAEKTKKIHNFKIKNRVFNVGDRVLLFNSRLKIFSGKLKTRGTEPFIVAHAFPYGTIELSQADGPNFKDCPDCKDSRAYSFIHRPLDL